LYHTVAPSELVQLGAMNPLEGYCDGNHISRFIVAGCTFLFHGAPPALASQGSISAKGIHYAKY